MGGLGVSTPSFLVGLVSETALVLMKVSNVLSNVLVLNYLSFKVNGSYCVPEHRAVHVTSLQLLRSFRLQHDPDP